MSMYKPEGMHWEVKEYSFEKLNQAMKRGEILEAKVVKTDERLNMYLDLGDNLIGKIKYSEIEYSPNDKKTKSVAIMSKVGKTVRFKVTSIENADSGDTIIVNCSRAAAQKDCYTNYINKLTPGDIIKAHVTHIEDYGIFCDIGNGIIGLLPIENISIIRITNPKTVLRTWKDLYAVVKSIDDTGRVTLTHKELLGTWESEVSKFKVGETVPGIVKTIEPYGVFIQLSQNLSGLAEVNKNVRIEDNVNVFIKDINPETMKIKLNIVSSETPDPDYVNKVKFNYTSKHGRIEHWQYSPKGCSKQVGTRF